MSKLSEGHQDVVVQLMDNPINLDPSDASDSWAGSCPDGRMDLTPQNMGEIYTPELPPMPQGTPYCGITHPKGLTFNDKSGTWEVTEVHENHNGGCEMYGYISGVDPECISELPNNPQALADRSTAVMFFKPIVDNESGKIVQEAVIEKVRQAMEEEGGKGKEGVNIVGGKMTLVFQHNPDHCEVPPNMEFFANQQVKVAPIAEAGPTNITVGVQDIQGGISKKLLRIFVDPKDLTTKEESTKFEGGRAKATSLDGTEIEIEAGQMLKTTDLEGFSDAEIVDVITGTTEKIGLLEFGDAFGSGPQLSSETGQRINADMGCYQSNPGAIGVAGLELAALTWVICRTARNALRG